MFGGVDGLAGFSRHAVVIAANQRDRELAAVAAEADREEIHQRDVLHEALVAVQHHGVPIHSAGERHAIRTPVVAGFQEREGPDARAVGQAG